MMVLAAAIRATAGLGSRFRRAKSQEETRLEAQAGLSRVIVMEVVTEVDFVNQTVTKQKIKVLE